MFVFFFFLKRVRPWHDYKKPATSEANTLPQGTYEPKLLCNHEKQGGAYWNTAVFEGFPRCTVTEHQPDMCEKKQERFERTRYMQMLIISTNNYLILVDKYCILAFRNYYIWKEKGSFCLYLNVVEMAMFCIFSLVDRN